MDEERIYIEQCKNSISIKLSWSPAKSITQRDFEYLSEQVYQETRVSLSTTTLRRIWSNQYKNLPQVQTLNAMAKFLGFSDWNNFKSQTNIHTKNKSIVKRSNTASRKIVITGLLVILIIAVVAFINFPAHKPQLSLTIKQGYRNGVPATIGFDYDISNANEPIEIELSWNPYERTVLDPSQNFYTGVYHYPDYHITKLRSGEEILHEIPVYVTTDNWHALVMTKPYDVQPVYINESDFLKEGQMGFEWETLEPYLFKSPESIHSVFTFSNEELNQFDAASFTLNARLRSHKLSQDLACKSVAILIKAESGSCRIPIANLGCYGGIKLNYGDNVISGKTNNLEMLTADLSIPQNVRLNIQDGAVTILLGENKPYSFSYANSLGRIKVVKFIFDGLGSVEELEMQGDGKIYKEDFESN